MYFSVEKHFGSFLSTVLLFNCRTCIYFLSLQVDVTPSTSNSIDQENFHGPRRQLVPFRDEAANRRKKEKVAMSKESTVDLSRASRIGKRTYARGSSVLLREQVRVHPRS